MKRFTAFLKAKRYGVRDYKAHLSEYIKKTGFQIITHHGEPKKVVVDYDEMIELLDIMDELNDPELIAQIQKARKDYKSGKGYSAVEFLKKM